MISWWLPYLAKGPTSKFNNGIGNDFNSGTGSGAPARTKRSYGHSSLHMLTSLGQPTIRPGRTLRMDTSTQGSLLRKKKNKVEEIQLTDLASLGSLASKKKDEGEAFCVPNTSETASGKIKL